MTSLRTQPTAPGTDRQAVVALLVFSVVTAVTAVPLWWWQPRTPEVAAALPVASLAPLSGDLAVWVLAYRAGWDLGLRPPRRPSPRVLRRVILATACGGGIILGVVQLRTFFGWDQMPFTMVWLPLPLAVIAVITMAAVTAQEIGFRGVLQPVAARRWAEPVPSVIVATVWTAWAIPGLGLIGPVQVALMFLTHLALSLLITRLRTGLSSGRTLVAIGFRWVVSLGLLISGDEEAGVVPGMLLLAAVSIAAAALAPFVPRWAQRAATGRRVV